MFCFVTEKLILKENRNGEDEILQICSLLATPICHHSTKFASPWYLNDIWFSAAPHCSMCSLGSTMALQYFGYSRKNTFSWENNTFEAIFPRFFWEENLKTCFAFHLPALQTLFQEHSKSVIMIQKSQIQSLKVTVSLKIKFSVQLNKLGQIHVK